MSRKSAVALRHGALLCVAAFLCLLLTPAAPLSGRPWLTPQSNLENKDPELYQALLDLQNPWTVMCVAAHPDDEDGATLTILRRKYGAHTVTLFTTYGEGGQNATGPELYEELGAIRARETLAASEIQGSEAHFLGLPDFGFSKSAEEAFSIWGRQEALRRMVLKIRQLRPDVIITNHNTSSGHGHHQATGQLILEAFDAAADPASFPEQLRGGLKVWQAQRLFVRVGAPGAAESQTSANSAQSATIISINRNERDEVRGTTYAEQALRALQQHATQGPWPKTLPASWASTIRYRLTRSAKTAAPLPSNAQTFLDGLSLRRELADRLTPLSAQALLALYKDAAHENILSALVAARKGGLFAAPSSTSEKERFSLLSGRLDRALVVASGIKASLAPHNDVLILGTTTRFSLKISNEGEADARIRGISFRGLRPSSRLSFPLALARGASVTVELQNFTPPAAAISVPAADHLYDGQLFGQELAATASIEIDGATFPLEAVTRMDVAPAVEIASVTPSPLVLTRAALDPSPATATVLRMGPRPSVKFSLRLVNHQNQPFSGDIIAGGPVSKLAGEGTAFKLAAKEAREVSAHREVDFTIVGSTRDYTPPIPNVITFSIVGNNNSGVVARRRVRVVWSDARVTPGLRVGYVRSFDDTLRDSLAALKVEAKELKVKDVQTDDLSKYHAIIIDNRGYQAHPELIAANSRLLDYVKAGGTLIVFYHRTNEWNPDPQRNRPQLAPYPIIIGNSRITDETAPIEFTEPQHPLLNYPNKIGPEDFKDWIQERGLYYPQSWDNQYSALLAASDKGEALLRGGLLAADYGRGRYIYTSMVWYRQLRAGQPGAYRVLANMISYGRKEN